MNLTFEDCKKIVQVESLLFVHAQVESVPPFIGAF